jgi:hypothetical protein
MRHTLVGNTLPTVANFSQESTTLTEKLATQIRWMQKKGISIKLKDSERPPPGQRSPLPGTTIYFSSIS